MRRAGGMDWARWKTLGTFPPHGLRQIGVTMSSRDRQWLKPRRRLEPATCRVFVEIELSSAYVKSQRLVRNGLFCAGDYTAKSPQKTRRRNLFRLRPV